VGTVLIYLNSVARGGATAFPELGLSIAPEEGLAVVFFPCTAGGVLGGGRCPRRAWLSNLYPSSPSPSPDGLLDRKALHAATEALDEKWVSQVWLREAGYYAR